MSIQYTYSHLWFIMLQFSVYKYSQMQLLIAQNGKLGTDLFKLNQFLIYHFDE